MADTDRPDDPRADAGATPDTPRPDAAGRPALGGPHRAAAFAHQRRFPPGAAPPRPAVDAVDLDEDGLPTAPDPDRLRRAAGIHTDD